MRAVVRSVAVAVALGAGAAGAQDASSSGVLGAAGIGSASPSGAISTGRPSYSFGPGTVPRGFLQIEGGFGIARDDGNDTVTAPNLVFRAGVADRLELRLGWAGLVNGDTADGDDTNAADIVLGFKRTILDRSDTPLTLGVLGQVSVPTGGGAASSDSVDPSAALLWSFDAPGPANAFGTVIVTSLTNDDDGRYTQVGASLGAGVPLSSNLNGYVEYYGVFADEGGPSNNIDGGLLFLVNDNFQLDVFARVGLNDGAGDHGFGAGFGLRF